MKNVKTIFNVNVNVNTNTNHNIIPQPEQEWQEHNAIPLKVGGI